MILSTLTRIKCHAVFLIEWSNCPSLSREELVWVVNFQQMDRELYFSRFKKALGLLFSKMRG
jgi:hypothetical protein